MGTRRRTRSVLSTPELDLRPADPGAGGCDRLLLVDGTGLAYKAYHAIRGLATSDGRPTNALFGFVRMLNQLRGAWQPTHWAVVFDGGRPAERVARLETYKAQRPPTPNDLLQQLRAIDEYLDCARVPWVLIEKQEADDLMATLARRGTSRGAEVLLATHDKDLYQIVTNGVSIVPLTKGGQRMGPAEVEARTGVPPARVAEWLALIGDPVDNVPGVPGVGPKTAAELLRRFGSLPELWANLDALSPRLRAALEASRGVVERNLAIVRLRDDLEVALAWDALRVQPPDAPRLRAFLERYELKSLAP